jgi:hypothetical protein
MGVDDKLEPVVPPIPMPAVTLIMDGGSQRQLLWIDGYMPVPVGARVQLGKHGDPEPPSDAIVTGVRLWGAAPPGNTATLVLDVMRVEPGAMTDMP